MTLLAGIFVASILGSIHCGAMCGAFVCAYAGSSGTHGFSHVAYNAGRLASYIMLGALAGMAGGGVERAGTNVGLNRAAAIIAGVLMVAWAGVYLAGVAGVRVPARVPEWPKRVLGAALVHARDTSPGVRAGLTGLVTTLLPCGWLYVFVTTAAASGHVLSGVAIMITFWLGTLPMMMAVGAGAQRVFGRFARRLPVAGAMMVLVFGVLAIAGKMRPIGAGVHEAHAVHHVR